jgi:hypothetical protein
MAKLKDGYNSIHIGLFHQNYECICNICRPLGEATCVANNSIVTGVRNMCDHILGSKGEIKNFHKLKCIQGDCSRCGISTLQLCPHEVNTNK